MIICTVNKEVDDILHNGKGVDDILHNGKGVDDILHNGKVGRRYSAQWTGR